eukprot:1161179-Pelagomonas_calceolata.AAC.2
MNITDLHTRKCNANAGEAGKRLSRHSGSFRGQAQDNRKTQIASLKLDAQISQGSPDADQKRKDYTRQVWLRASRKDAALDGLGWWIFVLNIKNVKRKGKKRKRQVPGRQDGKVSLHFDESMAAQFDVPHKTPLLNILMRRIPRAADQCSSFILICSRSASQMTAIHESSHELYLCPKLCPPSFTDLRKPDVWFSAFIQSSACLDRALSLCCATSQAVDCINHVCRLLCIFEYCMLYLEIGSANLSPEKACKKRKVEVDAGQQSACIKKRRNPNSSQGKACKLDLQKGLNLLRSRGHPNTFADMQLPDFDRGYPQMKSSNALHEVGSCKSNSHKISARYDGKRPKE